MKPKAKLAQGGGILGIQPPCVTDMVRDQHESLHIKGKCSMGLHVRNMWGVVEINVYSRLSVVRQYQIREMLLSINASSRTAQQNTNPRELPGCPMKSKVAQKT